VRSVAVGGKPFVTTSPQIDVLRRVKRMFEINILG
jgi:hypothetical protein